MPSVPLSVFSSYAGRFPGTALSLLLEQASERTEVEVEIGVVEPELPLQLLHAVGEEHERLPETLDLVVVERALLHAAERLALHQLPQELDQRQHELGETALDLLRVGVDAPREHVAEPLERSRDAIDVAVRSHELVAERLSHRRSR